MTAKEFLKSKNIWTSMYVSDMSNNEKYFDLSELLEEYANQQLQLGGVSKSFAIGKTLEITCCIYGHQFNKGELVRIINYDSTSAARWLCTNTKNEYWLSEREANVC